MSDKNYSPREAAMAVLKRAHEMLSQSTLAKAEIPQKDADKDDKNIKVQSQDAKGADRVQDQPAPSKNPDEQKENNNPPPGAEPQNEGEDYGEGWKGHIKLAKFIGHVGAKRKSREPQNG